MMRKQYTAAFKAKVVQEFLKEEKGLAQKELVERIFALDNDKLSH